MRRERRRADRRRRVGTGRRGRRDQRARRRRRARARRGPRAAARVVRVPAVGCAAEGTPLRTASARPRRSRTRCSTRAESSRRRSRPRRFSAERRGDGARPRAPSVRRCGSRKRRSRAISSVVRRSAIRPTIDPAAGRRYPASLAHEWLERAEPFVLEPDGRRDVRRRRRPGASTVTSSRRCDSKVAGSARSSRPIGDRFIVDRQLGLLAGLAHQAKLAIESAEHFEGSSARSSPRSRRSRTRSRRTTSTRRHTPAGSATWRSSSGASSSSTATR